MAVMRKIKRAVRFPDSLFGTYSFLVKGSGVAANPRLRERSPNLQADAGRPDRLDVRSNAAHARRTGRCERERQWPLLS